jgi:hypothetical protein
MCGMRKKYLKLGVLLCKKNGFKFIGKVTCPSKRTNLNEMNFALKPPQWGTMATREASNNMANWGSTPPSTLQD